MLLIWPWSVDSFDFKAPGALLFLLLVPIVAGVYVWMQFVRKRYAVRYASVSLLREAVGKGPGIRRHMPAVLYLLALAVMVFALARPAGIVPQSEERGIVMLTLDVSGSMWAEDVAPNRMEATKKAARDFVSKQPKGVQIGVVSFTDFAALLQPPTRDKKAVTDAIDRLQPQRGTNMGGGLQVALDAIYSALDTAGPNAIPSPAARPGVAPTPTPAPSSATKEPPANIVLVSDGDSNTGPQPLRVAEEAQAAGVKVFTVGIGTPEGTVVRIQGRSAFTRLNEDMLRQIAEATGGQYYNARDAAQLEKVYDQVARERQTEPQQTELTYYLTGTALLLSLIAGAFSLAWFNRLP